jgi:hypothetical protein
MQKLVRLLKNYLLKNHWATLAQTYMKTFWHSADLNLYTLQSLGVWGGNTRGETIFICVYWKESFKINILLISIKLGTIHSCMNRMYSNEGPCPLQREGGGVITFVVNLLVLHHKSAKIGLGHLNIFFSWNSTCHKCSDIHESFLILCRMNFI